MTFTDRHGHLISYIKIPGVDADEDDDDPLPGLVPVIVDDIEIPEVDVEGPEAQDAVQAPQVKIDDLDISHDYPSPIEVAPTQEEQAPEMPEPVALPAHAPGLHGSTSVRSQTNKEYTPRMSGSKYSYTVTQIESQGVLNPNAHMFMQTYFYQADIDAVAVIMTQLSLMSI
jgi:hypothetical protein